MSRLKQCPMCGAIVATLTSYGVCVDCVDEDEKMFVKVKSSIKFGEQVLPDELAAKNDVDIKHINRWINSGRFV